MKLQNNKIPNNKGHVIINQQEVNIHVHINTGKKNKNAGLLKFTKWVKRIPKLVYKYLTIL